MPWAPRTKSGSPTASCSRRSAWLAAGWVMGQGLGRARQAAFGHEQVEHPQQVQVQRAEVRHMNFKNILNAQLSVHEVRVCPNLLDIRSPRGAVMNTLVTTRDAVRLRVPAMPRGAAVAAALFARALNFLFRPPVARAKTRAEEAWAVRELAYRLQDSDPSLAADLHAAAARHEALDDC
jgi:hypothetical protein